MIKKFNKSFLPIKKIDKNRKDLSIIKKFYGTKGNNKANNFILKNKNKFKNKIISNKLKENLKNIYKSTLAYVLKKKIVKANSIILKEDKAIKFTLNVDKKIKKPNLSKKPAIKSKRYMLTERKKNELIKLDFRINKKISFNNYNLKF